MDTIDIRARQPLNLPLLQVQLRGDEARMGQQHGELTRASGGWQAAAAWYPGMAQRMICGGQPAPLRRGLPRLLTPIADALLDRMGARRPAWALGRSHAFAAALGLPARQARTVGVMDLFQNTVGCAGRLGVGGLQPRWSSLVPGACSTLAVWGEASEDGRLLVARNFDFPGVGVWEAAPEVVFCTPNDGLRYAFATTRGADTPCVSVWNEAGLVLSTHTRLHSDVRLDGDLIVDMVHDVVRSCATVDAAIARLRAARSASSWGIFVASGEERRAALVELTASACRVVEPRPGEPLLACTNRYQSVDLHRGEVELSPAWVMHSDGRHLSLRRAAQRGIAGGGLDVEALQRLLGSHEDPEVDGTSRLGGGVVAQPCAVQSVVVDPERRCTWLSVGAAPTGHGPFVAVDWRWADTPGSCEVDLRALRRSHQEAASVPGAGRLDAGRARAHRHIVEAARLEALAADAEAIEAELTAGLAAAPHDPTLQLLASGIALRHDRAALALQHAEAALDAERAPFYRERALLWTARAADVAGRRHLADAARRELLAAEHPRAERHRQAARRDDRWRFDRVRARMVHVAAQLCDLA